MKKRFQGILDFHKGRKQIMIKSKVNETILASILLRNNGQVLNVEGKKINIFISSVTNNNEILYSSSVIKVINAGKGLIQFELPGFTFSSGEYLAEIEVLDIANQNFLSCDGIHFEVTSTLNDKQAKYLISQRKIETLFELDRYVAEASARLLELEKRMEVSKGVK